MNVVDIAVIVIIALCGFFGYRKGVIREIVQLLGTGAIAIVAYVFKDMLADFLMGFMPFLQFKGVFLGIS